MEQTVKTTTPFDFETQMRFMCRLAQVEAEAVNLRRLCDRSRSLARERQAAPDHQRQQYALIVSTVSQGIGYCQAAFAALEAAAVDTEANRYLNGREERPKEPD